jgi:ABC-type uncharacterized transport system involved in gliding motility auxiliary subunit
MTNRRFGAGLALALLAILFLGLNTLSNATLTGARLDLTANRLYTLSDGTKAVLASLTEPVRLRFFYSERLTNDHPELKPYGTRVREMLDEFVAASGGKVRLEVIDPEPFSEAEDEAVALGLSGTPLDSGETFYFGVSGSGPTDARGTIPFFSADRQPFLEYDLTKLVHNLTGPTKKVVGIITSLPIDTGLGGAAAAMRGQARPFAIYDQLKQFFDVRMFAPDLREIGQHIDLLVIAHPGALSDQALYAIDQFVMNGGRVLALVDPYSEVAITPGPNGRPQPGFPMSSNLDKLFAAWGIKVDGEKLVADRQLATRVSISGGRSQLVDYVLWLSIPGAQMAKDDVVTASLNQVIMATAGAITPVEGATTKVTPLITSTPDSMLVDTMQAKVRTSPEDLLRAFQPSGKPQILAARVTGPAKTAFPDGPPKQANAEPPPPPGSNEPVEVLPPGAGSPELPQVKEAKSPINVVVIADSDVLDDRFWVQDQDVMGQRMAVPTADNGSLIVNAVDNLSGTDALIGLRSRGEANRPFEVVERMRRDAEQRFLSQQQQLQAKLEETQRHIQDLRSQGVASGAASAETDKAIAEARAQVVETRRQLREVQRNLQRDIDRLETVVKVANIGFIPVCVAVAALVVAAIRVRRRRRAVAL